MSPERRRWLSLVGAVRRDQVALATKVLERMGTRDALGLNRDETRDVAALIALCEQAAVLCYRIAASLSDDD